MQCNWCSYVCPHGVIRPFVLDETEVDRVNGDYLAMKGVKGKFFTMGISALDCTGRGSCAQVCPARKKALEMTPAEDDVVQASQEKIQLSVQRSNRKKKFHSRKIL